MAITNIPYKYPFKPPLNCSMNKRAFKINKVLMILKPHGIAISLF